MALMAQEISLFAMIKAKLQRRIQGDVILPRSTNVLLMLQEVEKTQRHQLDYA